MRHGSAGAKVGALGRPPFQAEPRCRMSRRNQGKLMPLLRFFDSAKAVDFGKAVAEEFCRIHALQDRNKKHQGRKSDRTVALVQKASKFSHSEKLNFYARAKMLAEIKQGLKDGGIDAAETQDFIRAIALERLRAPARG
jgi:hypothetical protein